MRPTFLVVALALVSQHTSAFAQPSDAGDTQMKLVGAGTYRPLFPISGEKEIPVRAFRLDPSPVTNGDFLSFVVNHAEWRRDRVAPVFADAEYLAHWQSSTSLGPDVDPHQPVVDVSWFAANAFCAARRKRLPSEAEWEHAALASKTAPDGMSDVAWRNEILAVYSHPNPTVLPKVPSGAPNYWGIYDMHGVVWEWVLDYGNAVAEFSNGSDRLRFCGASGANATDATDFAAFERVAFRSSLKGRYAIHSLGFRCAADVSGGTP